MSLYRVIVIKICILTRDYIVISGSRFVWESLQNLLYVKAAVLMVLLWSLMNILLTVQLLVEVNALIMSVLVIIPTRLSASFEDCTTGRPLTLFVVIICAAWAKSIFSAMVMG